MHQYALIPALHEESDRCHGLVPSSITLVATPPISNNSWMPRACPVEYYARRYTADLKQPPGCHGLVPWSITLVATPPISNNRLDATGLSRGVLRSSLHRRSQTTAWMPRACPVEYYARRYTADLKQPPGCHGLVPWSFTLVAK